MRLVALEARSLVRPMALCLLGFHAECESPTLPLRCQKAEMAHDGSGSGVRGRELGSFEDDPGDRRGLDGQLRVTFRALVDIVWIPFGAEGGGTDDTRRTGVRWMIVAVPPAARSRGLRRLRGCFRAYRNVCWGSGP